MLFEFATNIRMVFMIIWFTGGMLLMLGGLLTYERNGDARMLIASAVVLLVSPAFATP